MRRYITLFLISLLLCVSTVIFYQHPFTPVESEAILTGANDAAGVADVNGVFGVTDATVAAGAMEVTALTGETEAEALRVIFIESDYFYTQSVDIVLAASVPESTIYYTTDGSEPTTAGKVYSSPLPYMATRTLKVIVVKAIAVHDGQVSQTYTHTYFIGEDINERFDTLVFSLSTDPVHLYDYDEGIFVAGRLRDEFIAENPDREIIPPDPANYNVRGLEGERPVYVEVLTPDGTRVIAQDAGVRVNGGWSRAAEQKSLRLTARNRYAPGYGKFNYPFFPEETADDGYGTPILSYDTLILRNGANDREFGMLRNEVASLLARDAGFRAVTPMRAASVFINGDYYGFAWLEVLIDESYLQDVYQAPTADFDIVGDGDLWVNAENYKIELDWFRINRYANKDLTDEAIFAELEKLVDVENLLTYYAFEIYMGNEDWPQNNLKRWRYTGPQSEGLPPELDGRWRYILYDLDWTLGLYGDDYTLPSLARALESENSSPLLAAILKRADMAEKFTMILCDLAANVVTRSSVAAYIDRLSAEAENEWEAALRGRKYPNWVSMKHVLSNHADMIDFATHRKRYIFNALRDYFGYEPRMFDIQIEGGEAMIGTQRGTEARYFASMTVPVRPFLSRFEVFDAWLTESGAVYEPEIWVSGDKAGQDGQEPVTLTVSTHEEKPDLIIEAAYAAAGYNGCILVNTTDHMINTRGLYLSDTPDDLFRWAIPAARVAPGGSLAFAGKDSADIRDWLKVKMGFDLRLGEVLFLTDETGRLLDYKAASGESGE